MNNNNNFQNKNSAYDWFKGKNASNEKRSAKDNAKEAWKWAKIFTYISLFIFSMVGCVQIWVVKTNNSVGNGVEIFHNESTIAPRVKELEMLKSGTYVPTNGTSDPNTADYTKSASFEEDVYYLFATNENVWINKDKDGEVLGNVHKSVEETQGVKMSDAIKGVNSSVNINASTVTSIEYEKKDGTKSIYNLKNQSMHALYEDKGYDVDNRVMMRANNEPIVFSSAAKKYDSTSNLDLDSEISFYIPVLGTYDIYTHNGKSILRPVYKGLEVKIPSTTDLKNNEGDDRDIARLKMAKEFFQTLTAPNELHDYLFFNTPTEAINKAYSTLYLDIDTISNNVTFTNPAHSFNRMETVAQILGATGLKVETEKIKFNNVSGDEAEIDVIKDFEYQKGQLPGWYSASSDWRALVTWSDAWKLGPFYALFVYPIGATTSALITAMGVGSGWEALGTIFIVVFTMRLLTFAINYKSVLQQQEMQDLNGKKAIIEAKYVNYQGNKQMEMRKRQEISDLYKKNGINPLAMIGGIFLTMPIFLSFWRVMSGIPHLKSASWLGIVFSETSWRELLAGHWQYLPLMLVAAIVQLISQLYPRMLNKKRNKQRLNEQQKEAMKKQNQTQNIMMGVMVVMAVIFSAGLQIYWIIGGLWRILEVRISHSIKEKQKGKQKLAKNLI